MTPPLAPNGAELVKRLRDWAAAENGMAGDSMMISDAIGVEHHVHYAKKINEAADHIEALKRELAEAKETTRAETIALCSEQVDTALAIATSAELTVTALRERLEGIAEICAGELSEEWASLVAHSAPSPRVKPDNFERAKQLVRDDIDQIHALAKGPGQ